MTQPKSSGPVRLTVIENAGGITHEKSKSRPYAKSFDSRRRQILTDAWDMIAEHEGDEFTLIDLSTRSGVALRTLYNAFGDKDGVIAQAVAAHYVSLFTDIDVGIKHSCTLAEAVEMAGRVGKETCRVPAFSTTGARMYFSPKTNPKIVESLRQMPIFIIKAWSRSAEADRKRIKLFGRDELERSFANMQWGLVNDWAAGRIDDQALSEYMQSNVLLIATAFGNRAGRAEARRLADLT